jgi:hypothetical protein
VFQKRKKNREGFQNIAIGVEKVDSYDDWYVTNIFTCQVVQVAVT